MFDLSKINHLYHLTSIKTILKSRARNILKNLPKEENIIYNICISDSKILNDLAKCVGNIIKIRDSYRKNDILKNKIKKIEIKKEEMLKIKFFRKKVKEKRKRMNRPKNCYFCKMFKKRLMKIKEISNRKKREYKFAYDKKIVKTTEYVNKLPLHLKNLHRLEEFARMQEHVRRYIERINHKNEEVLNKLNYSIKYKFISDKKKLDNDIVSKIISILNDYIYQKQKYSIFSPRLFNIFPSCESNDCKMNQLLSPTLFSFHNKDGFLSLPEIFKSTSLSNTEINKWINTLIDLSGAGNVIKRTFESLEEKIIEMENTIYPTVIDIENKEKTFKIFKETLNDDQKNDYIYSGYSFLNKKQIDILFDKNFFSKENERLTKLSYLTKDELEEMLDKSILSLAKNAGKSDLLEDENLSIINNESKNLREKRESKNGGEKNIISENLPEEKQSENEDNVNFSFLRPYAFSTIINDPSFIEIVALSPAAFIAEIASPEAASLQILDPQAFVAAILSPNAIFARILKPGFFRTEILSPSAINSWILSPDIFMAEILSPKLFEAKILSPQYIFLEVLSPGLLSPNLLSSDKNGLVVLSPRILSPLVESNEAMVVEVLSPHILSGQIKNMGENEEVHSNEVEHE